MRVHALPLPQRGRMTPPFGRPLRERLDVGLFVRQLFGRRGFRLARLLPRRKLTLPKEYWVHGVVVLIAGAVMAANLFTSASDRDSLLFALFQEGEVEEGPLPAHRSGQAQTRGPLLGLVSAAAAGGVTEDDIEFELANILAGNAVVGTASPETAEASAARRSGVLAYSVAEGDTPGTIAARYGISTNSVLWANGITDGDVIRPGDVLVVLPVSGVLHTVKEGDDVTSIAQRYDAKVEDVIARNGLDTDGAIRAGQKLIVPDGQIRAAPRRLAYHEEEPSAEEPTVTPPSLRRQPGLGFLWPTANSRRISQYFGWRHTGVDISDRSRGSAVAAQGGTVSFSGWLGGYGRLVILDHGRGMSSYYAHLSKAYVAKGQRVSRGEAVGAVGCTGRCTGPHLHFEVRSGGRPVNPLRHF